MSEIQTDVLVIGSGIAGLSYAIKVATALPNTQVTICTKSHQDESNSKYAQGGIAVVQPNNSDSFDKHIEDTLSAGGGINDRKVVELVVKEGPDRFNELLQWGAEFDFDAAGKLDLGLEGGHSEKRIIHKSDYTGLAIESALLKKISQLKNIAIHPHFFVVDLLTDHHLDKPIKLGSDIQCYGAFAFDKRTENIVQIRAQFTLLATGGAGQVYDATTNPIITTADGIGLAYRAKAFIKDMQFIQFHPTAFYQDQPGGKFLISEAVRGAGAVLRDENGAAFMQTEHPLKDLAPRDIVARAIHRKIKSQSLPHVWLDCTSIDPLVFKHHFSQISAFCKNQGIDPSVDFIPVKPAMHYLCGGIEVNTAAETNIKGLLAIGETTRTGLHGGNRLASNSLLEAIVYAHLAAETTIAKFNSAFHHVAIPQWNDYDQISNENLPHVDQLTQELKSLMTQYVGIVRSHASLSNAKRELEKIHQSVKLLYNKGTLSPALFELRNMVAAAYMIIIQSEGQLANIGTYFNEDLQ